MLDREETTMVTVSFSRNCEIWQVASDDLKTGRPSLAYVHVHPTGYLMATDTTAAAIVPCTIEGAPADWPGVLIPAGFLKEAAKNNKTGLVTVTIDGPQVTAPRKNGGCLIDNLGKAMTFPRLDIILKGALKDKGDGSVSAVGLDPWLMCRAAQAIGREKNVPIFHEWSTAERVVLVYGEAGALALVMPGSKTMAAEAAKIGGETLREIVGKLTGEKLEDRSGA
jgi:hypothetical protein